MDSQRFNLTKGDILGKLLMVSVPIIGTQLMLLGYNLVDMFLLGRVSADAVASSGSAGMYLWLGAGVMLIGRMGAEIGVAQAKGRGDSLAALSFSHNSLFLAGLLGTFCAAVSLMFSSQLIRFLNIQEAHVAAEAERYLFIVAFGMPAVFLSSAVAGSFTGAGNSRTPFVINAIGLALNAALDPLFIFTLEMGVAGAAVATIIAQNAACVLSFYWLLRRKDRPFPEYPLFRPPAGDCIKTILRWTIPVSVENLLFTFFAMLVARYVADYGAAAITVSRVGSQIESLCWLICLGFSSGLTAFVGQNFGAGKWSRIRTGLRKSLLFSCSWGLFVSLM
ncbi:MAG: MATE family efflux transporter, partial [Planctomycetes bacterium]|nr:MATE family efflux transporter [Planctomycetota bacterium]